MNWNQLTKIKAWVYLIISLLVIASLGGIAFISIQNIDKNQSAQLLVDKNADNVLKVDSNFGYQLSIGQKLFVTFAETNYEYKIKNIKIDEDNKFLVSIEAVDRVAPILPNTYVNISFALGTQKIYTLFIK